MPAKAPQGGQLIIFAEESCAFFEQSPGWAEG